MSADTILAENVNHPGKPKPVNRAKYEAMRNAVLAVLPTAEPGFTYGELKAAVLPRLPEALFPGGETAGWWIKTVQLDLEAKDVIVRQGKPLRWRRTA